MINPDIPVDTELMAQYQQEMDQAKNAQLPDEDEDFD